MSMAEPGEALPLQPRCWCCDKPFNTDQLVHLGSHPEVTVCRACARNLNRRAAMLTTRTTPTILIRRATQAARDRIVASNLHERPVVGPFLRWLDKFLP